jgi:phthalate 4,5-cis-dihydrodiol dehydrogenase
MLPKLKIGVAGLGRAFAVMLPTLVRDPRVALVAAADPREEARRQFEADFQCRVYREVTDLCADPNVEAVYVATPHQFHAQHAIAALSAGKHVLVEKPMALSLDECRSMIAAAQQSNRQLVVGHSHSFDAPILQTRKIIERKTYGEVRMISALDYTDFLYRPRRPEELDTAAGGGVFFNQAAHQVDILRLLAGSPVTGVRCSAGAWDPARPTEGAYSAHLAFAGGAFASAVYSGYAHFDSDEFQGWIGEMGNRKDPESYGFPASRKSVEGKELETKNNRNYGGKEYRITPAVAHQHFGLFVVSCEKADLRPMPNGVMVYSDTERRLEKLEPPAVPRAEVIDELYGAVMQGRPALHDGAWAMATLQVCLAMLESSRQGREIIP